MVKKTQKKKKKDDISFRSCLVPTLIPFKTAAYINYNTKIRVMTDPEPQYIKKNPKDGGKKR